MARRPKAPRPDRRHRPKHGQRDTRESRKTSGFSASLSSGISYGKSSQKQNQAVQTVTQVSSTLSGADVTLSSGRDTTITASNVLADRDITVLAGRDITVLAGRDINILAAADTEDVQSQYKSSSTSVGLTPGLAARFTMFGKADASQNGESSTSSARTSLLSANSGDLTLIAGIDQQYKGTGTGNVTTQGADLLAGDAITLSGNAVDLQAVANVSSSHSVAKSKSITVGAAPAGTVGGLITAISDKVEQAQNTDNDRLKGALALKAGYDAYKLIDGGAAQAIAAQGTTARGDPSQSAFGVSVSIGVSKSKSESTTHDIQVSGTNLQGQRIDIEATETDLHMTAAKLQAEDIALTAKRDILLEAAANQSEIHSSNKSSNYGAGVTFGIGQQNGISFQLSASQAKGKTNGSETTWDNTLITASNTLTVKSGRDTTLMGAQLAGDTVKFDIGRNLLIESLQDNSAYYSKQDSSGFSLSLCIPPICYGTPVTGSVSVSDQKIKHNYQSAVGQSGIAAGEGGFDITVGNTTELVGAAITGSSDPSKNHLTTASLTSRDLINTQNTEASSSSLSVGYSGYSVLSTLASNTTSNLLANLGSNAALPEDGSESSSTRSVISPATINITGTGDATVDEQSQATADELTTRDPQTVNQSLTNTLTLQQAQVLEEKIKEQKENQEAANLVGGVLSNMVGDLAVKNQWGETSPQKIALHGLVGLIEAQIGGGNAAAGVLGAISQEVMAPILAQYLKDNGFDPNQTTDSDGNPFTLEEMKQRKTEYDSLMQLGATLTGTAIGALADGTQGATTAGNAALQGVTNNFLGHESREKLNRLKAKRDSGKKLTDQEAKDLVLLEIADQTSDGLLTKYLNGGILSKDERQNLATYLGAYERQDGVAATIDLLKNGSDPTYSYPYAGTTEQQDAYMNALAKANGGGVTGALLAYLFRERTADENAFISLKGSTGLGGSAIDGVISNEAYLPTELTKSKYEVIDALLNSPVLATGTYLGGTALGVDKQNLEQATVLASIGSDILSSFVISKAGISPVFGETTAKAAKGGVAVEPVVTAKGTVNGAIFEDVNQTAKVGATNDPTLIADRIAAKVEVQGKSFPNGTVADSHAEIGVIQQAYNAGKTQGEEMSMTVSGKDVCGFCKGDIAAAADAAGLKSLTVQAVDNVTGLPKTYYWQPGMKSIKEKL